MAGSYQYDGQSEATIQIELNPYASVKRYEEGSMPLLNDEIEAAVDSTTQVIDWCRKSLKS
jgi:hypothetical protein